MLHPLNTNSTTYLASAIRTANSHGDNRTRDNLTLLLNNLLTIKNSITEKNISRQTRKIPFDIDTTLNALESKEELFEAINLLKRRINFAENNLLKNKSEYIYKVCELKNRHLDNVTQCNRILLNINLHIPEFENKVELNGSNLLPEALNGNMFNAITGEMMTFNEFIIFARDSVQAYEKDFEQNEKALHQALNKSIEESRTKIEQINQQIESLNAALDTHEKTIDYASFIVSLTNSPQKVVGNLRDLLFYVQKQEKHRLNAATALHFSPQLHKLTACAQTGNLDEIVALIAANQALPPSAQFSRKPIVYELVKEDKEHILNDLTARLGTKKIEDEFKRDVLQALAMTKPYTAETLASGLLKEKFDEIMNVLYNASSYSPALIKEGQYLALSKKLAIAYNSRLPNIPALLAQAEATLNLNLTSATFDIGRIHKLIRYLVGGKTQNH